MGTYRAIHSDNISVRLVHEPVVVESETVEFRNPSPFVQAAIVAGKRYLFSMSFTEAAEDVPPVVEPPVVEEKKVETVGQTMVSDDPSTHPVPPAPVEAAPGSDPTKLGPGEAWDATPEALKHAEKAGVDMGQVQGTGPGGTVTKDDVIAHDKASVGQPNKESAPGDTKS